jgi:hypothetical protein
MLLDRIKELEAQMTQLRRTAAAQPGFVGASTTSMQSLEQRVNEQDTLIRTLMQRLKSVTTFGGPELKPPAATSRAMPPVQPFTSTFPEQSSLLP